jgi:cytochrome b6-f complex iron-sulfur subunit
MAEEKEAVTRRESFVTLGVGCMAVAGAGATVFGYQFLSPNVLYEPSPIANGGKPDQYALDSITADPKAGIYIVHSAEGFYALSAVCTHLGCLTTLAEQGAGESIIACPCHGSKFHRDGVKIEGPAPRPLPWLRIWISDEGDLLVDRAAVIPPKQYLRT